MNTDSTYLDMGGLTYPQVLDLQDRLQCAGISSNISTGSIRVNVGEDEIVAVFPDLKDRVLRRGESPFVTNISDALKLEKGK